MKITYENKQMEIEEKTTVDKLFEKQIKENKYQVLGCRYNNEYRNLETEIEDGAKISLIDTKSKEGMKIYIRTLVYIMGKAFERLYPNEKLTVEYQLGDAMFCKCDKIKITNEFVENLKEEITKIVEEDLEIKKVEMTRQEAKKFYEKNNTSKGRLQFDLKQNKIIYMYFCEDYYNYCFGTLANRTGVIKIFDIIKYQDGFLIRYPSSKAPEKLPAFVETKKLAWALEEFEKIHSVLDVITVYKLNQ